MIPEQFVWLSVLFSLCGAFSYLIATLRGKTQPNRVTWFMWALAPLIASAAQLKSGDGPSTIIGFVNSLMCLGIYQKKLFGRIPASSQ